MRMATMAFGLTLALSSANVVAQEFDTPKALLEDAYGKIEKGQRTRADEDYFSDSLRIMLIAADEAARAQGDAAGALNFSPFVDGQDPGRLSFSIGEPVIAGDSAIATVKIIGGSQRDIVFMLVKQADGWQVDDVVARENGGDAWRLSEILAADPLLN